MGYYSQRLDPTMRINQKHEQEIVKNYWITGQGNL